MTLDTQMTLALLQELLMALRANDADGYKSWFALGIEQLGKPSVIELLLDWMDPILTTEEADRLVGWHLGVSLRSPSRGESALKIIQLRECNIKK